MEIATARRYFENDKVVHHYARAANNVGLWVSEERIFQRLFKPEDSLLELGCGAGRISIGLWELGYRYLLGVDYSKGMIDEARRINRVLEYGVVFQQGDATALDFDDESFDGAIFGFNGLMQIPGRANRQAAMRETCRVLKPGSYFVFTGHDRDHHWRQSYWKEQRRAWRNNEQHEDLTDFGDLYFDTPEGVPMFIHAADSEEVRADLKAAGFCVEADVLRSELCNEPKNVRDFSDDTRFWIAQKHAD